MLRALAALGCSTAWMLGDTPDDVVAARLAGVLPIGVLPPASAAGSEELAQSLREAGAATVLTGTDRLLELLP